MTMRIVARHSSSSEGESPSVWVIRSDALSGYYKQLTNRESSQSATARRTLIGIPHANSYGLRSKKSSIKVLADASSEP